MSFKRLAIGVISVAAVFALWFVWGWYGQSVVRSDAKFVVEKGQSLGGVSRALEAQGIISSGDGFLLRAKLFGGSAPIQSGEFMIKAEATPADILALFQGGGVVRQFITIPEGMPSIMVYERVMAHPDLTGEIPVPVEGTVLPDTYEIAKGEPRTKVLARMQAAMQNYLAEAWPKRASHIAVTSAAEAVALASIVEKETAKEEERRIVAGLYSNRLLKKMRLQADPTIIYPITKGKPLGRRIRKSEIAAINGYNTYSMAGLPKGPITNPGRASIAAVLDPAQTDYIYMVADGTGGHEFTTNLADHQAAVDRWVALRRAKGEL